MGRSLIIMILGTVITLSFMKISMIELLNQGSKDAIEYYDRTQARNLGNSMVNIILSRLADNPNYRTTDYETKNFSIGSASYQVVEEEVSAGDTLIKIEVDVNYNGYPKNITTFVRRPVPDGWVPPSIRASWTANGDLNNTISDMLIDGRDHDLNLNVIPNSGKYGVSSSVLFNNDDNAAIGGTYQSADYQPTNPEDRNIIEESFSWGGSFPDNPDEILGYPAGTLKAIAQSGIGGSQYVLNPNGKDIDEKVLNFPLKGVTYVEITDGEDRQLKMQGPGNTGIVIVHGPGASSRLGGVKMEELKVGKNKTIVCHSWGQIGETTKIISVDALDDHLAHGDIQETCGGNHTWFQGLIVTDYSFHHHIDILGAIIQLSPNLETSKNCGGNEDHWVKYSSEAIEQATQFAAEVSGIIGNNDNNYSKIGFGHGRQKVVSWFE